ncbi:unnamed protein product [Dicrocoelium dendriticum]|nr:unnamed protein product [Dicrocoelium dendriticum]
MAKKRTEVTLQEEIETQEQWDNVLQREGLLVIDIYQEWCGPCKAAVGIFKRMKSELNDDLLNFAVAKADAIESLERYRGKCEPCFLFFGSGHLVAAVRGINPPEIIRNITEKLKLEHEVLRGEAERIEIKDPVLLAQELAEAEERRRKEEEEEILQETTIVILKPDVVKSGKAEEIISELRSNGIEILQRVTYQFTKEDVEKFYARQKDEPYFNKLVEFMTSGPSEILLCVKGAEGIIEEVKALVGPALYDGKEGLQGLRARYATDTLRNAIHAADGKEEAARELAFFYPDYNPQIVRVRRRKEVVHLTPSSSESDQQIPKDQLPDAFHPEIERTVALLRPQAYAIHKDAIMERIKEAGFVIAAQKEVKLSKEQAEEYYSEHRDEPYFGEITTVMSSGPILALLLTRQDAVETWRKLLGPADIVQAKSTDPGSLRAQFAPDMPLDEETEAQPVNLIHGSATVDEVDRDIQFFFPVERTVAAIKPDAYENRDEIVERIKAAGFQVSASRDLQLTTEMAQELYRNVKDKPFYEDLIKHMTSGPTLFMVVTRQDAVSGWRKLMGPTDPDKAANEVQESTEAKGMSIRATYGRNMLQNAVHGSSSEEHALSTIKLIFGDPETGLPDKSDVETAVKSESPRDSERGEAGESVVFSITSSIPSCFIKF